MKKVGELLKDFLRENSNEDPAENPPPDGYTPPFYRADRVAEYRQAHAVFSERLRKARGEGDMR